MDTGLRLRSLKASSGSTTGVFLIAVCLAVVVCACAVAQGIPQLPPYTGPIPYTPDVYQRFLDSRSLPLEVTVASGVSSDSVKTLSLPGQLAGQTLTPLGVTGQPRILVVVNDTLYPQIETRLNIYVSDLQNEHYDVVVLRWTGGTAEDLRAYLKSEYDANGLAGCVLIGQLPYALYEDLWPKPPPTYEAFPCDWFFMDLDAQWLDTDPFGEAQPLIYDGYVNGANPGPEILVGRIDASNLDPLGFSYEVQRTNAYLDKTHAWHSGTMPRTKRVLSYNMTYNSLVTSYPDGDLVPSGGNTTDFRERISRDPAADPTAYEYIDIHGHGSPWGAQAGTGWYSMQDVCVWPARPQFINLRHCQTSLWTYAGGSHGCLGSSYIFNGSPTTLLSLGSSKVTYGSELTPYAYSDCLAQHMTIGEAYRHAIASEAPYTGDDMFILTGIAILGDPLIRPLPPPMHVKPDGDDSLDGWTWDTAKRTIGGAIAGLPANSLDAEIWVAAGSYGERLTFTTTTYLYGGFAGTEEDRDDRDPQSNPTIIDGMGGDAITIPNRQYGTNQVDGFTIHTTGGGRGMVCTSSPLVARNVNFVGNSGADGAGIFAQASQLAIENCTFSGGYASGSGGGLYAAQCTGSVLNCSFSSNVVGGSGGGIYLMSSGLAVTNCSFAGNSAFVGGAADCEGSPAPTITGCTFSNNTANYYYGGAVNCNQSPATLSKCTFTGNMSWYYGGAVNCTGSNAAISDCTFTSNTARVHGGAIRLYSSSATINRCTLTQNTAQTSGGGAIYCENGAPVITRSIIRNNTTGNLGGGIRSQASAPEIANNIIDGNTATWGAGIFAGGGSSADIVNNTIVNNMSTPECGSAIWVDYSPSTTVRNNIVAWNSYGILANGGTVILSHNDFWWNYNGDYWGGLYPDAGSFCADPMMVSYQCGDFRLALGSPCVDSGTNEGAPDIDLDGHVRPMGSTCDVGAYELCRILVKADSPGPTFDGLTWQTAFHTIGEAMAVARANDEIWVAAGTYNEAVVMKNSVKLYGGFGTTERSADERDPSRYVTNITGGGAENAVTFNAIADPGTRIEGFRISNSTAEGVGIRCFASGGMIASNTITGNGGGGVRIYETDGSSLMTVALNTITDNHNEEYGGGVYLDTQECEGSYSNAIIVNNVIRGNTATYGAGICAKECDAGMAISSNTIVDNTASNSGGGIYMTNACPTIENNIVVGNSIYGISSAGTGGCNPIVLPLRNNDVYDNSPANYYQVTSGPTDISADPLFLNRAGGDLHIGAGSPCINIGCNNARGQLQVDIDGQTRITGAADIGADEYAILHVSTTGDDANGGFSWAQAKRTIQGAIDATSGRSEIWVRSGTYAEQISLKSGNQLFGGFAGTETRREQRNWTSNVTTIYGGEGSSTITMSMLLDPLTRVDGFTVSSSPTAACRGIDCNTARGVIANDVITGNKRGGIYIGNDSIVTVASNTISGNYGVAGGGVEIDRSAAVITGNTIAENGAASNGGYCAGGIYSWWSTMQVNGNTIDGNSCDWYVGGISAGLTQLAITDNTIRDNAGGWAGGVLMVNCCAGDVSGNTVTGNSGSECGGILYSSQWDTAISNNVIAGNVGAGIFGDDQGTPIITNNTIVDNTGGYGGVYLRACGSPLLQNNIIAYNVGYGVYAAQDEWMAAPILSHNDVFGNSYGGYMYTSPGVGDISSNPFFARRDQGNYRLKGKSPCIDTGVNTDIPCIDKDGRPRPVDGDGNGSVVCDMGAYERPTDLTGVLRDCPDGNHVDIRPVSVTACFAGADPSGQNWVYVENTDRSAGIRIKTDKTFTIGDLLAVSGLLLTDTMTGERYIAADGDSPESDGGTFTIKSIGMANRWVGGHASGYQPVIKDGRGFYNVGLLIGSWGRVTYADSACFYIDDGSHLRDGSGHRGVRVVFPTGTTVPAVGAYVKVKGISGASLIAGNYVRTVRVRSEDDITTVCSWISTWLPLLANHTNAICLPGIPAYSSPESVFVASPDEFPILLDGNLRVYDPGYQQWIIYNGLCGPTFQCLMGDGYLLHIPQGGATKYAYARTPVEGDQVLSLPSGSETGDDFSLVGNPFEVAVPWASCLVTDGSWTGTLADAVEAGMIHKVCTWNGSSWLQIADPSVGSMASGTAYEVYPACNDLAIILPAEE